MCLSNFSASPAFRISVNGLIFKPQKGFSTTIELTGMPDRVWWLAGRVSKKAAAAMTKAKIVYAWAQLPLDDRVVPL